jgi:hypothetical protein
MWVPFPARRMCKRYSTSRHVFSSICGVAEATALVMRARSWTSLPTSGWNIGSFTRTQKKKKTIWLHRGSERAKDWAVRPNPFGKVLLTDNLPVSPQCQGGIIVLKEDVWVKVWHLQGCKYFKHIEVICTVHGLEGRMVQSPHDEKRRNTYTTWARNSSNDQIAWWTVFRVLVLHLSDGNNVFALE